MNERLGEIQWPDMPFDFESRLALVMRRGSESHGLYIPPEDEMGTDDRDIMAVTLPPPEFVFGLKGWTGTSRTWSSAESIKGVWDVVVYDWRKFIALLVKQNPNVVGMLWLEDEDYLLRSEPGRWLIEAREAFRARAPAYEAVVEYARAQLEKMTLGAGGWRVLPDQARPGGERTAGTRRRGSHQRALPARRADDLRVSIEIRESGKYRARVRIRRGVLPVKPECEALDGREFVFRAMYRIEPEEDRGGLYRGEWAMMFELHCFPRDAPPWIASGDLEILETL